MFDQYADQSNYQKMKEDQISKLKTYGGLGKNYLFLLSWTLTGSITNLNIEDLAQKANSQLSNELHDLIINKSYPKPNIVYIDFVNENLTDDIIQYNFDKL